MTIRTRPYNNFYYLICSNTLPSVKLSKASMESDVKFMRGINRARTLWKI